MRESGICGTIFCFAIAAGACTGVGVDSEQLRVTGNPTDDNGTALSVAAAAPSLVCTADGSGADVTIDFTVTSTAAANAADLTASIDGGAETSFGTIASGSAGWTMDGRTKTAAGELALLLGNGEHTVVICATQNGARGRLPKRACTGAITIDIDCAIPDDVVVHCNQGVGNGSEGCDPGNSNNHNGSNDENGGVPGDPGRKP